MFIGPCTQADMKIFRNRGNNLASLPVIVGFGGINAAGRASFHHAYRRMISDVLGPAASNETYTDLAMLMNLLRYEEGAYRDSQGEAVNLDAWLQTNRSYIEAHTLVRELEDNLFDPNAIRKHVASRVMPGDAGEVDFILRARHLPKIIPENWRVEPIAGDADKVRVTVAGNMDILIPDLRQSPVKSAGQLPSGFQPNKLYSSRNHPRGLQMTVYAASDAIQSMGIEWQEVLGQVSPDQIGVYSSAAMSQLDQNGVGGMLQASLLGKRVTSKQCPLGFAEMPADFVNAYIIGSVGGTGANIGACATFLYNLRQGIEDIRAGHKRVVIVGTSEAPITPEVMEGYRTMGALAQDDELLALDAGATQPDHRRACRPFSTNCGFTLAEAAHYVVLFDDALALELGANIHGAVGDVFVNADGYKKSISSPGVGNYVTMAKALAATRAIIGDEALRNSYVQAHGTSTPQNRVTESRILNEMSKTFSLGSWPVAAVKSYVGHSIGSAAADQLISSLGVWGHGYIPGIKTIDHLAEDVEASHLNVLTDHLEVGVEGIDAAIINSKGFGGNNATASILAPHIARRMMEQKHGRQAVSAHAKKNEQVQARAAQYNDDALKGRAQPIYHFGEDVKGDADVSLGLKELRIEGYENPISLDLENPYSDMC